MGFETLFTALHEKLPVHIENHVRDTLVQLSLFVGLKRFVKIMKQRLNCLEKREFIHHQNQSVSVLEKTTGIFQKSYVNHTRTRNQMLVRAILHL